MNWLVRVDYPAVCWGLNVSFQSVSEGNEATVWAWQLSEESIQRISQWIVWETGGRWDWCLGLGATWAVLVFMRAESDTEVSGFLDADFSSKYWLRSHPDERRSQPRRSDYGSLYLLNIPIPPINGPTVDPSSRPLSPSKPAGFQSRPKMAADTGAHRAVERGQGRHRAHLSLQPRAHELKPPCLLVDSVFSCWGLSSLHAVDEWDGTQRGISEYHQ